MINKYYAFIFTAMVGPVIVVGAVTGAMEPAGRKVRAIEGAASQVTDCHPLLRPMFL